MNIVANTFFLRNLRNLDFFTLDLGKTKRVINNKDKNTTFRKLSEFEIKYGNLYNRGIMIFGTIGRISFYEDLHMERNKYLIFNGEDIYEIEWSEDNLSDFRNYILDTLRRIDNIGKDDSETEHNSIEDYDETWEARDEKNRGKKYLINQNLSKDEYRNELLKRFEKNAIKK